MFFFLIIYFLFILFIYLFDIVTYLSSNQSHKGLQGPVPSQVNKKYLISCGHELCLSPSLKKGDYTV